MGPIVGPEHAMCQTRGCERSLKEIPDNAAKMEPRNLAFAP